jgi:hypothetical protein
VAAEVRRTSFNPTGSPVHALPSEFREAVLAALPDLASEIDANDGIHVVMGTLGRAVMAAVTAGDYSTGRAVLTLLDVLLNRRDLDGEIPNAVSISFVEPQSVCASALGRRLWSETPQRIRALLLANQNRVEASAQ